MTQTFERLRLADVATRAGRILDEVERVASASAPRSSWRCARGWPMC